MNDSYLPPWVEHKHVRVDGTKNVYWIKPHYAEAIYKYPIDFDMETMLIFIRNYVGTLKTRTNNPININQVKKVVAEFSDILHKETGHELPLR